MKSKTVKNPPAAKKKAVPKKTAVKAPPTRAKKPTKAQLAKRAQNRRRWLPPLAGLLVAILVFGLFNSQLLSSRVAYYLDSHRPVATLDSQTIASPISKTAPPSIIINSINVNAPITFETQNNETIFLQDLQHGVVHYPETALPGQEGNVAIFGHSSGVWWEPGNYKFVFTLLDKVKIGDKIFIDYQGTRYIYRVYSTSVVPPTDLSVLDQGSNHQLTLITCTPVGTSTNRLIVRAEQYSPRPAASTAPSKPASLPAGAKGVLPGNSSSVWHNLGQIL